MAKNIKIGTIFTLYGRRAGAELYFEKLLEILEKKENYDFVVFCNREVLQVAKSAIPKITFVYVPLLNNQVSKLIWLILFAKAKILKYKIDILWIPSGANSFPPKVKLPVVVTIHDVGEFEVKHKYDLIRTYYRKHLCLPLSIDRATEIITVSNTTKKAIHKHFKISKPISVVYPGVSPKKVSKNWTITFSDAIIRDRFNLVSNNYILCPGRTDFFGKGIDILLKAYFHLMNFTNLDLPSLVFVGPPGMQHTKLEHFIRLNNNIKYLGRVSDEELDALYGFSKIVVISSRYEGFGFPILEAMMFEKVVVASNAGSIPEIAGDAAVLFDNSDWQSLFNSLKIVLDDYNLYSDMVERGRRRIELFNWDVSYLNYCKIFDSYSKDI